LVLYVSLYFHAFVAKEQQRLIEEEKSRIEERMKGLQGSLEDRAKMAASLGEENLQLKEQLNETKRKLEHADADNAALREELMEFRASTDKEMNALKSQVEQLKKKLEEEAEARKKEKEEWEKRNQAELKGLGVMKKNLEQHVEDLRRWQHYLDFDQESEIDFSGDVRPQILSDIKGTEFDSQLEVLAKKLGKENDDLENLLKIKETEKKAKKENDKKKKQRQKEQTK